jgi:hypothetical protein
MAAASPKAVASSASAMPGATTARLVVCDFEMPAADDHVPDAVLFQLPVNLERFAQSHTRRGEQSD